MCHTISHKYSAHLRTRKISCVNPHCKFSPRLWTPEAWDLCHMWWASRCHKQASVTGHLTPGSGLLMTPESRGDCHNSLPLSLNLENDFFDPAPDSVGVKTFYEGMWLSHLQPLSRIAVNFWWSGLEPRALTDWAHHIGLNITYTQWTMQIISAIPAQHFSYFQQRMCPTIRISLMNQKYPASRVQICQFEDFNELWKE